MPRAASVARKRRLAAAGWLPPAMAARLTPGWQAVAAVIAVETVEQGECTLPVGAIASKSGLSVAWAQRAVAELSALGWLTKELRPCPGRKNLTNRLRIVSAEWLAWIEKRPRHLRVQKAAGTDRPHRVNSGRPDQSPSIQ